MRDIRRQPVWLVAALLTALVCAVSAMARAPAEDGLRVEGTLFGRGQPVAGETVRLRALKSFHARRLFELGEGPDGEIVSETISRPDGTFLVSVPDAGHYVLQIAEGSKTWAEVRFPITPLDRSARFGHFELAPTTTLTIRVEDDQGHPLPATLVLASHASSATGRPVSGLPAGAYLRRRAGRTDVNGSVTASPAG